MSKFFSRYLFASVFLWITGLAPSPFRGTLAAAEPSLSSVKGDELQKVRLEFFWSKTCPHCRKAKPFLESLSRSRDWLEIRSYELSEHPENAGRFLEMAKRMGRERLGVPAFVFCNQIVIGFDETETTGDLLQHQLEECLERKTQEQPEPREKDTPLNPIPLPFAGKLDPSRHSLPALTLILAGLDSFNPCAFFVLLFLLSLMVNAKSRSRMLIIGGIFVFFSGLIYFAFMAAWLNLFRYLGEIRIVTLITALVAIGVAVVNIKDYFFFREGVSLSIPDKAKAGIYARVRNLVQAPGLSTLAFGTMVLAVVANSYELLCTSGFPMVFTRILTLNALSSAESYLYLALYNVIYVIPLAIIVILFSITLGSRKLTEREGRVLKLVSGMMMLGLGGTLLLAPEMLSRLETSIGLVAGALILSWAIAKGTQKASTPRG